MTVYLQGSHFLSNKDEFPSFHILKVKTNYNAYLSEDLIIVGFRQQLKQCKLFTWSVGEPSDHFDFSQYSSLLLPLSQIPSLKIFKVFLLTCCFYSSMAHPSVPQYASLNIVLEGLLVRHKSHVINLSPESGNYTCYQILSPTQFQVPFFVWLCLLGQCKDYTYLNSLCYYNLICIPKSFVIPR